MTYAMGASQDITGLRAAWGGGNRQALDGVIAYLYPEMRRIAPDSWAARPVKRVWSPPPWPMKPI